MASWEGLIKIIEGFNERAFSNNSRTRAAPTPTNNSTNCDPETFKKQALQFLETTNTKRSLKALDSFDESWHEQFNQEQKEKLIAIVKKIEEKRFSRTNYILLFDNNSNMKSINLQYNVLVCWADSTNDSSTKRLQNSVQKPF